MANSLGNYIEILFAQRGLATLKNALRMGNAVYRGYESERNSSFIKGNVINVRRPGTFTVENAPSTAQDVVTDEVAITLDQWKEVKFKLPDNEGAWVNEQFMRDHIDRAAYEIANHIDSVLHTKALEFGPFTLIDPSNDGVDLTLKGRKALLDNKVPMMDPSMLTYAFSPTVEQALLSETAFAQYQGSGGAGVNTQQTGELGIRYGMRHVVTQNTASFVGGGKTSGSSVKVNAGAGQTLAKDTSTIPLDGLSTGGVGKFDRLVFANHSQVYTVVSDTADASSGALTVTISPSLRVAVADNVDVTVTNFTSGTRVANPMFHRDALALVLAPLPDNMGQRTAAAVATVTDPDSGLSLRSRLYYVGDSSEMHAAIDVLYGVQMLDARLGVSCLDPQ
jgi:hypothetical protein